MLSGLTKINCILVIVTVLSSILAAGIVQDTFAGEKLEKASAGGEVETTGGYFYRPGRKFFLFTKVYERNFPQLYNYSVIVQLRDQ